MPTDARKDVAERIVGRRMEEFAKMHTSGCGTLSELAREYLRLSAREQKVRELVEAAEKIKLAFEGSDQLPYIHGLDRLRAAIKELGEQP